MVKPDKRLDLGLDAKRIKGKIKEYARKASNEEELKIKVEGLIQEVIPKFFEPGKEPEVAYEHRTKISGRREDALYGTVIIEYKAPKKLDTGSEFVKAKEQIEDYIKEEAGGKAENFGKFFGVIKENWFEIEFKFCDILDEVREVFDYLNPFNKDAQKNEPNAKLTKEIVKNEP